MAFVGQTPFVVINLTSSTTLTAKQCNGMYLATNVDAGASITTTLPTAAVNMAIDFWNSSGQDWVVLGQTGDTFILPDGTATNAVLSLLKGESAKIVCVKANTWHVGYNSTPFTTGTTGIFGGGINSSFVDVNTIDMVKIQSASNASDFGDLSATRRVMAAASSTTRGIFQGGNQGTASNTCEYITIQVASNVTDFGDLVTARFSNAGFSSNTRGISGCGDSGGGVIKSMDYCTIASPGNYNSFGDATVSRQRPTGLASTTRGIVAGGEDAGADSNVIDYLTIASIANMVDFGDLSVARDHCGGCASNTKGLIAGAIGPVATVDQITIASTGNATNFANLIAGRFGFGGTSSPARAVWGGGSTGTIDNVIQYQIFSSAATAVDFGDLTVDRSNTCGLSDAHGGIAA